MQAGCLRYKCLRYKGLRHKGLRGKGLGYRGGEFGNHGLVNPAVADADPMIIDNPEISFWVLQLE